MICCLRKTESMQAITIWRNWLSWEKNEIKKDFVYDTAVYMGNHSNIFRSSYFYKIEKISAYEISRMCRYKMEYKQWTKPWAVYIHAWWRRWGFSKDPGTWIWSLHTIHRAWSTLYVAWYYLYCMGAAPVFWKNPQRKEFAIYCLLCRSMGKQMGRSIYRRKCHMELDVLMFIFKVCLWGLPMWLPSGCRTCLLLTAPWVRNCGVQWQQRWLLFSRIFPLALCAFLAWARWCWVPFVLLCQQEETLILSPVLLPPVSSGSAAWQS